ncbi:SDR family NAD(P)-dependent oxidoreductase [Actinoallomurus iriomotensis]|uniref:Ketoreductase domain-containing protein n=1 Tax=Actinoallomurus iriomotensis TaxID=478107 RepID=A0A9W6W0G9_9ACTN|nr:SDR family oxidoreductase [Actinoallomurus iriomotensis]GLY92303.1 hypothetical protein Airi02_102310 [Actinoallomurus iriomotensis]
MSTVDIDTNPRTAVVTGAASGIGAAVATELVAAGWDVHGWDVADGVVERARHHVVDVADAAAVRAAAAEHDRLDLLVNCAGIGGSGRADELTPQQWDRVIGIDLSGTFYCCNALYGALAGRRGSVVNIASIVAHRAGPGRAAYCTAKAGVVMLTEVLATDWGPDGIRVNAVSPGYTRTPMVTRAIAGGRLDEQAIRDRVPLDRLADPAELARLVRALTGPDFAYMTGATVLFDGGWTANGAY